MNIKEINQYWEKIINTMNDGLMVVAPDCSILMVNSAFEQMTGYTSKEITGQSCKILECDACESTLIKTDDTSSCRLFRPGQTDIKRCRCHALCKDGTFLPILKNASILRDDHGTAMGVVETLTDISELTRLDRQVHQLERQVHLEKGFYGILGNSRAMRNVFDLIEKAAESNAPVIILGESGTGKELVANAIHMCSSRKQQPFIKLNCAALNESLLESELFGHVKGAFTGAHTRRTGRFEAAHGGSFFLDEIGDAPLSIQTKLLRVLESGQFEAVGDVNPTSVDVRIITATNQDLNAMISRRLFREDLFFRINVIPIHLPPLRHRTEEIPLLVNTFIHRLNSQSEKTIIGLTPHAMERFMAYEWPGNIRELKNALEYAYVITEKDSIHADHLPRQIQKKSKITRQATLKRTHKNISLPRNNEKEALVAALKTTGGNQSQAARILGINRVTVWNRMKKYGIDLQKIITQ
ncbi:PAS domain S-box-containing protein [Desulfocicer vacuolatum DSM 3385]|uniref:PAS domain S-box-containing protein n=1 Tax=Desulfocicer vacuolatum DSM 3385 TaxID=1121400 RepID=A0A1W2DFE3_9BACT|nr:sigma 54-interacting transcriptional regulator [Desulfocicer vacuolatum]SMC96240.1 PAS domain S-box-containing protein [Desulfocicer vacuolatum DSM 3385]